MAKPPVMSPTVRAGRPDPGRGHNHPPIKLRPQHHRTGCQQCHRHDQPECIASDALRRLGAEPGSSRVIERPAIELRDAGQMTLRSS
jgi:hypothetical protein